MSPSTGWYELALDLRAETPPGPEPPPPVGPFVCVGGDYDSTASAVYSRLGQQDGNSAGVHYYWKPGDNPPKVPTPFWAGGNWAFPHWDGTADTNVSPINTWRIVVVGPGSLTVHSAAYVVGGGAVVSPDFSASVKHYNGSIDITDFTQSGVPGVDEVIDIPEDAALNCVHFIDISCAGQPTNYGMGAVGCTWVLADA